MTGKVLYPHYIWSSFSGGFVSGGEINTIMNEGNQHPVRDVQLGSRSE